MSFLGKFGDNILGLDDSGGIKGSIENHPELLAAALIAAGVYDPSLLGLGASDAAVGTAGLSSADAAALYGSAGYGEAATAAELAGAGTTATTGGLLSGGTGLASLATKYGPAAAATIGGLLGSKGVNTSATQQNRMDPRMDAYVYGANGTGGLLADAAKLYANQSQNGGLNANQRAGLNMQLQTLQSPQFTQGYDTMRNMGMSLMNGGVASNPFK